MQPVPLVIRGEGAIARAFRDLVDREAGNLAGREGFQLMYADECGPHPSIVVDAGDGGSDVDEIVAAVWCGHAAVTAHLDVLTGDPAVWGVLASDRRVGVSAALMPGLPLVALLTDLALAGVAPVTVALEGDNESQLAAEAVGVARLLGHEIVAAQVRSDVLDAGPPVVATIGEGTPTIAAIVGPLAPRGERRARVQAGDWSQVTLSGAVGAPGAVALALGADVVALAREGDRPWRAHRRRTARS
jgi:hypothetical protein